MIRGRVPEKLGIEAGHHAECLLGNRVQWVRNVCVCVGGGWSCKQNYTGSKSPGREHGMQVKHSRVCVKYALQAPVAEETHSMTAIETRHAVA